MSSSDLRKDLLDDLYGYLGPVGLLQAQADIDGYRNDLSGASAGHIIAVARPASTADVVRVVQSCARVGIPITPRGGGTGLSGGATPVSGTSLVVCFERMRAIRAVDPVGNHMVVEAGVTLQAAQQAAQQVQRQLGLDHGGAGSSQIGGNLSTNAGGNNVVRYGMAREQVLGLEVVLADGRRLDFLAPLRKNNAGYDLKGLFLGSEGTLGLITAATLRLRPAAKTRATMLLALTDTTAVMACFARSQQALGECLTAVELMPGVAFDLVRMAYPATRAPFAQTPPWMLLLEAESSVHHCDLETAMGDLFEQANAAGEVNDGNLAASQNQRQEFWTLRERIAHVMIDSPICLKMDTAVPIACIPDFLIEAGHAVHQVLPDCRPIPFGHVGDGNIHFNVLGPQGMPAEQFARYRPTLADAIEQCAVRLGGTISAEHGVGLLKKQALVTMRSAAERDVMSRLRTALDPNALLNPGKVIDSAPSSAGSVTEAVPRR